MKQKRKKNVLWPKFLQLFRVHKVVPNIPYLNIPLYIVSIIEAKLLFTYLLLKFMFNEFVHIDTYKIKTYFFLFSLLLTQTSSSYLHQSGMKVYRAFVSSIWSSSFLKCVASDSSFHSFQFVTQYVRGQAFHKSYESLSSSLFAPHHLISHSYVSIFIEKFYSWIYKSVFFQWIPFLVFLSFTCTRKLLGKQVFY